MKVKKDSSVIFRLPETTKTWLDNQSKKIKLHLSKLLRLIVDEYIEKNK